jgi:ATP-dependent helicase HrpA
VFEAAAFDAVRAKVAAGLVERTVRVARDAAAALEAASRAQDALDRLPIGGEVQEARDDINHQLGLLIHDGFLSATGATHVSALARYLDGMVQRLAGLPTKIPVDRDRMHAIHALEDELAAAAEALGPGAGWPPHLTAAFWTIQELRLVQLAPGTRAEGGPSSKKVRRPTGAGSEGLGSRS